MEPIASASSTVALCEIIKYQKSTELLIRKLPFQRLLRLTSSPSLRTPTWLPSMPSVVPCTWRNASMIFVLMFPI